MDRGNPRRLLLFAYYFPPLGGAGSRRALSFAVHLRSLGWEVAVVAPREGVYGKDPSLLGGGLDRVEVVRTGTWEPSVLLKETMGRRASGGSGGAGGAYVEEAHLGTLGSAVRGLARKFLYFPDSARGWVRPAVAAARRLHAKAPFSVVLSSSPPVSAHCAARRFALEAGLPLVLDFRDLWEPAVTGTPPKARKLLDELLESAAAVATVSEGYARWFGGRLRGAPARVVYNGFEEDGTPADSAPAEEGEEPFLLHAGTTYAARQDFRVLGEAVRAAAERSGRPLRLRLVGRVDDGTKARLEGLVRAGAASIEEFRRSDEVAALQSRARAVVAWAWSGGDAVAEGHLPAKLFEALQAGRPVLLIAGEGSDAAALGRRLGLRPVDPGDAAALATILDALAAGRTPPGTTPDPGACRGFTRAAQAAVLRDLLEEVRTAAVRP